MEQLNIVGKRSGDGFVAHKATLVNALSRVLADRVTVSGFVTVGRKGFAGYLKALAGSNVVKVTPVADSVSHGNRMKVTCGSNTSYLEDLAWVGEKTPMTMCEVRVSSKRIVKPNIGGLELAEALNRVIPFTATDDARPVLQCVLFKAGEGKLTLASADGFRLAVVSLDYDENETGLIVGEAVAKINRDELRGVPDALRKAKRVRVSFEAGDVGAPLRLLIDTELIRYKWEDTEVNYPQYEKLIPTEFNTVAHFDTVEAGKAVLSLSHLTPKKTKTFSPAIDLTLDTGIITMTNPDDTGEVTMPADIEGKPVKVRLDQQYLAEALKACGGMVDFNLTDGKSPVLFTVDGYQLVVMPMMTHEAAEQQKADTEPKDTEPEAEPEAEPEPEAVEPKAEKPKRSRKREKVAVA